MTLHLPLTAETEAKLREEAAATGLNVEQLVLEAVEEKLSILSEQAAEQRRRPRNKEEWLAEFRTWVASHETLPSLADDSRESIYEGRGE